MTVRGVRLSACLVLLCFCGALPFKVLCEDTAPQVKLHVKASDPNGGALTFKWTQLEGPIVKIDNPLAANFDDKSKKWTSNTFFTPPKPGLYTFEVTVRNEAGLETKKQFVLEAKKAGSE
jgi:hypothetical protein